MVDSNQMKLLLKHILLLFVFLIFFSLPLYADNNKALLIGISQYSELDCLAYADEDVRTFAEILRNFGGYRLSDIRMLLNHEATKSRIKEEFYRAVESSKKKPIDHFIIMFAGHGVPSQIQQKRTNIFLAPSDASTSQNRFFYTGTHVNNETFIDRAWLARQLASVNAKSIILIIDSCYSGVRDFAVLFAENLGYEISLFGSSNDSLRGVAVVQKRGLNGFLGKKIAFLASSREDQPAAEYAELQHGALSYCVFDHIREVREETDFDKKTDILVGRIFSDILDSFDNVRVHGRQLSEIHQPVLFPIPNFDQVKHMKFVSIQGTKRRAVKKGMIEIITEPRGAKVYVDGVNTGKLSNCTLELSEGKHIVSLFLPETNYKHGVTVNIRAGYLQRKAISLLGTLSVNSFWDKKGKLTIGPKLDVYLDGKYRGKTNKLRLDSIVAGTHVLKVELENVVKKRQIEIRPLSPLLVKYTVIRKAVSKPKDEVKESVGDVMF